LRKILVIVVLLPVLAGIAWWFFHQRQIPTFDPAYHEYAYISNGKSNTVSVIDLRTFRLAKTLKVSASPSGIEANPKKNEIYVVNSS